ncbi:dGTP triphosphohydrolase [Aquitalea sp. USM4]|uniref:dGTP triphosphohydrolase n=1 Tax=Aquitalea sp. USM4 TaxID=1590041 RepID=UPI0013F15B11|nr:dNTP triphosphohydrolase [Aquitalea sp. USM4]
MSIKFTAKRFRKSSATNASKRSILEEALSDRGRVIFSASFRRLMNKAQVFSLEPNASVRTRLTHSLEVAQVGMLIVDKIRLLIENEPNSKENRKWKKLDKKTWLAIRTYVETACLLHDIGNPPFGHFGEKAIQNWFKKNSNIFSNTVSEKQKFDFLGFDGNKQGFRIVTKLQRNMDDKFGLNLSYSQLASLIKYPVLNPANPSKCGYFFSERSHKKSIWVELGLKKDQRYPISFLMEAADDIAYCISDLEDAHEKNIIKISHMRDICRQLKISKENRENFTQIRTNFTNHLADIAAKNFILKINEKFKNQHPLIDNVPITDQIKKITQKHVYSSPIVLNNEIIGFNVIDGILNKFKPLMEMDPSDFKKLAKCTAHDKNLYARKIYPITKKYTSEPSMIATLPVKHILAYLDEVKENKECELFYRLHLITDYIAGMTDQFALSTYQFLTGRGVDN